MTFSGAHVTADDTPRLTRQIRRVFEALESHTDRWLTVLEIAGLVNSPGSTYDPLCSISAQLRNLRKREFGSWIVEGRYRDGTHTFEYRLTGQRRDESGDVEQGDLGL